MITTVYTIAPEYVACVKRIVCQELTNVMTAPEEFMPVARNVAISVRAKMEAFTRRNPTITLTHAEAFAMNGALEVGIDDGSEYTDAEIDAFFAPFNA